MIHRPTPTPRSIRAHLFVAAVLLFVAGPSGALAQQPTAPSEPAPPPGSAPAVPEAAPQPASVPAAPPPEPVAPPAAAAPSTVPEDAPPPVQLGPPRGAGMIEAAPTGDGADSWFARAPLSTSFGEGANRLTLTFFGFIQADYIVDTTRSYDEAIGAAIVARTDVHEGREGRTQFSLRNTRVGVLLDLPMFGQVKPTAVVEGDFFGHQSRTPAESPEREIYDSPIFRLRHAFLRLENPIVDVIAGQTYDVFGWQNHFYSATVQYLGLPNQVFSRNPQLRLSKTFHAGPLSIDLAASAVRPAQRDSQIPDGMGGIRFSLNDWKGISTRGNVGTVALPLSLGVSGVVRQFRVDAFEPPPPQRSNHVTGWGVSVDVFLPVIPAKNAFDRGNKLTLIGSFVNGTGIADLMTTGGGAVFPTLPNPGQTNPPPMYHPNVDPGLVSFDVIGVAHTIDWRAYRAGLQYYFPGSGRLLFAGNFTYGHSNNMAKLFPRGGEEIDLLTAIADVSWFADGNLFWDATPAVRLGLGGAWTQVEYIDVNKPHNIRGMGQMVYVF